MGRSHPLVASVFSGNGYRIGGQQANLDLSDGTRVVLSPESHLRIPGDFAAPGGRREVTLEGEAYFAVTHDSLRPFVVHKAHGSAEDLGTAFIVSAYPETEGTRLAVREGQVALRERIHRPGGTLGRFGGLELSLDGAADLALRVHALEDEVDRGRELRLAGALAGLP